MTRDEALSSIEENVGNQNLIKHMLATEAIMQALAERLGEDVEAWGLTGLLHDIDVELTQDEPQMHSKLGADLVKELGASEAMSRAILCHNEVHGVAPETLLEKALFCVDPLTGLITAGTLIRPDKKLSGLTSESLVKRFGEKRFAAGANREHIARCEEIGLSLEEFLRRGLEAMQGISDSLGL